MTQILKRQIQIERKAYDPATRELTMSFASEYPVARWDQFGEYDEVLSCNPADVDMTRMLTGGPLLMSHDWDKLIGRVVSVSVDPDRVCRAKCKISKSRADVQSDIEDEILVNASVGYTVGDVIEEKKDANGRRTKRFRWSPYEVSLLPVPADPTVGVGRVAAVGEQKERAIQMEAKTETAPAAVTVKPDEIVAQANKRALEIVQLAKAHNAEALAEAAFDKGWTVEQFRSALLDEIGKRSSKPAPAKPAGEIGMTPKEVKNYSFRKLILSQCPGSGVDASFEREVSQQVAKQTGRDAQGLFVPWDVQVGKRDLQIGGGGTGSYVVSTMLKSESFIEALRAASVLPALGVTTLAGLNGDIAIPKSTTTTGYWVSESAAITESQPTLSQVTGTPHTVAGLTDISRKLLIQSSLDVEAMIRDDLAKTLARTIDVAVFADGGSDAPAYLLGISGVNNPTVSSAGSATYAEILGFAADIEADNAMIGDLKWAMTSEVFYNLCSRAKQYISADGVSGFIADPVAKTCIGYPVVISNSVAANTAVLGVWSQFILGMWGNGLDVLVDPYSLSSTAVTRVRSMMDVDFMVRHPQAFAYNGAVTA